MYDSSVEVGLSQAGQSSGQVSTLARLENAKAYVRGLNAADFKLLVGLTAIAIVEAVSYAWIEVLLYTYSSANNPVLYDTWLAGHYSTYHLVVALFVFAMIFGVGFVAWLTYSPTRLHKFLLFAVGDYILWVLLEDEFTFIFSGAPHTITDWTNWPTGPINIFGYFVPFWYVAATVAIFVVWWVGLAIEDKARPWGKRERSS